MKISDVIQLPVERDRTLIYELMDSTSTHGRPIRVNRWTVDVRGESVEASALLTDAIAHAINSHDNLVDLVGRMKMLLLVAEDAGCPSCGGWVIREYGERELIGRHVDHEVGCELAALLKESEGIE